jgi:UDP-2,3-diacylglucosamine hydrolase
LSHKAYNTILNLTSLPEGKKLFFASDFHLGVPNPGKSLEREKQIVAWLDRIKHEAHHIFLVGDIFDFWFEYKRAIPKGFIRLQGKLAELSDAGINISLFTGNHDMWMFGYFKQEMGITVYREPQIIQAGEHKILVGHGDGLGPGDHTYKLIKKFFDSKLCQWLFARIHPNTGIGIANYWSKKSRISNTKTDKKYEGDDKEYLVVYCKEMEQQNHFDYYIFGHRHLPLDISINQNSRYINLGEWVNFKTYATYDGKTVELKQYDGSPYK